MKKHMLAAIFCGASAVYAQQIPEFNVAGRTVQMHAFASQGFGYSNENNYLTMNTSSGSAAMTDFGVNIGTQITDKFHVGAQMYDENIGTLGRWHPTLDWAFGDYKFKDWFGVRAGKVKTALGLFNDTQDMAFLTTWAILPQSMYPLDLRSSTISHTGGDVYGHISLRKAGSLDYTAYTGTRPDDPYGGYYINAATVGNPVNFDRGKVVGTDVRWTTPISGLTAGTSWMEQWLDVGGVLALAGNAPFTAKSGDQPERLLAGYADYAIGNWRLDAEYRRNREVLGIVTPLGDSSLNQSDNEFFASVAYRVSKRLELGTYNSRFYVDQPSSSEAAAGHIFDQTVTARIDLTKFWNVKVEGHFINGYGSTYSSHGFYLEDNKNGLKPDTNLLIVRTGFNF